MKIRTTSNILANGFWSCVATGLLLAAVISPATVQAQGDPKSNVNLIGMTPDPLDIPDIRYRQQNEPSCAIRPDDSGCIICAYNDYRAVDDIGDSWQGVSQSCNAGETWLSRLAPGFPGDLDAEQIPAEFAADPRLAAIPGMAIFNFIAGSRDSNVGVLAIQHWLEVNKEDADHYEPGRVTYIADEGTSGRFLDKPDMLAVLDAPNRQGVVTLSTQMENPDLGTIERDYPSGTLYVAYAVFTGSNSTKVLVKSSKDWGKTWANKVLKLSEDQNQVSGISLTAVGNKVLAVWRRRGDNNDVDSIMYSVISNGGNTATKGEVLANLCAFDQPTLTGEENTNTAIGPFGPIVTFRTNDFPWTANDGENFFVFYSDRGRNADGSCSVSGRPRIVMHHSTSGTNWNANAIPLEAPATVPNDSFQFMPTAFGANGRVQVAWYDTRREDVGGALTPYSLVADYDFDQTLYVQRTVDVYTTSVTMSGGTPVVPPPVRVSQYSVVVDETTEEKYENEASLANKKLFGQGTASFLGDYIAVAARQFRKTPDGSAWESNASATPNVSYEDFFAAWADNRDVRGEILNITDPTEYGYDASASANNDAGDETEESLLASSSEPPPTGPPRDTSLTAESVEGGDDNPGACTPENERTRDSNIYGSLIKDQLRLYAPTPRKPLTGLLRAFPLSLSNATDTPQLYTLEIINPSSSRTASFRQQSTVLTDSLEVGAYSSAARTVFVGVALDPATSPPVTVRASLDGVVVASVELGNSATFSDPENCADTNSCGVLTSETHNLTLQQLDAESAANAALLNAALLNAALLNPSIDAAALLNANLLNANLLNADLLNANLLNPTLVALALEGAAADADGCTTYPSLCTDEPSGVEIVDYAVANPDKINAALLNAALLNAALLNANLLNANLLNANLLNANLLNANLLNADLLNANLLNANLLNANLLNANLLNANLLNANLLNTDLLNANLLNANLLNANLLNAAVADDPDVTVSYDDYTYPITNNGNVTTSINADITINVPTVMVDGEEVPDILGTKLMAWTVNATPTRIDCEEHVQLDTRLQAVVANPDNVLEVADITQPFAGDIQAIIDAGQTAFFTLRVIGTPEQRKNVRISGFTASSQAANCDLTGCEDDLRDEEERILIGDSTPPVLSLNPPNPYALEAGVDSYVEPGATAIDNVDGDISAAVQIVGAEFVMADTVGTYYVDYNVSDAAGNMADTQTRTVNVADTLMPVIVLNGPANLTLEAGIDTYVEQGAVVTDAGNPATALVVGGDTVDTAVAGTYVVTYNAFDGYNNALEVTRTVTVQDTSSPVVDPVDIPGDLDPSSPYPFELAADADTISISWPVSVNDADPNLTISCSVDGVVLSMNGTPTVNGDQVTATFNYDFPVGLTTVVCTATDSSNPATTIQFTVDVLDVTPPVIDAPTAPVEIGLPVILPDGSPSFEYDFSALVSASDVVDDSPTLQCRTNPADSFSDVFVATFDYGDNTIECQSTDASGNVSTTEFVITVQYPFEVRLIIPNGAKKAGSTIPLDWQYFDRSSGALIDSSAFNVSITWASTDNCVAPNGTGMAGEDSGSSDFRYSASDNRWQYSWQTKDLTKGKYLVSVSPPGYGVPGATECVNLR